MSELRRRIFGRSGTPDSAETSPATSREHSPAPDHKGKDGAEYKVVPRAKLERLKSDLKVYKGSSKGKKRRQAWIFTLGGIFGILAAGFFATSNGGLDQLVQFAGIQDMNLDSILDILPRGVIKDVQELQVGSLSEARLFSKVS